MKRLRHPIRAITEPFGKAGLIVACLALVAAMGGTALAAAKLNGTQKKEVEKIAKKYAGKPGINGTDGAPGATGPAGPAATAGTNGTNGTNGKSAEASAFTGEKTVGSVHCTEGGVAVKSASPETAVCNGAAAAAGGFPAALPEGKTETGVWSETNWPEKSTNEEAVNVPISFSIPLELSLSAAHVFFVEPGHTTTACQGTPAAPEATPGNLCVYAEELGNQNPFPSTPIQDPSKGFGSGGAATAGAVLYLVPVGGGVEGLSYGTWAVTAPEAP